MISGDVCRIPGAVAIRCRRELERLGNLRLGDLTVARVEAITSSRDDAEFDAFIGDVERRLRDTERAYAYIDLDTDGVQGAARRAVADVAIGAAILNRLSRPIVDARNGTPFNIATSSAEPTSEMRRAGVGVYGPSDKLRFHNDAIVRSNTLGMPKYVGLLNLFIGYDEPGNLYWLPLRRWPGHADFVRSLGEGARAIIEAPPLVYETDVASRAADSAAGRLFSTTLFPRMSDGIGVFVNGTVHHILNSSGEVAVNAAEEIQQSLLECESRIALPQRVGRLTLLRNDAGLHCRDIFRRQLIFRGTTRASVRMISESAINVGAPYSGRESTRVPNAQLGASGIG